MSGSAVGVAYVPAQYETWPRSTPWGGSASPKVSKFADATAQPIELGERISAGHATRADAVGAAKAFVRESIVDHRAADDTVRWADTRGAVVVRDGASGFAVHAASGPIGTPTWALENGQRVPGAIQFADRYRRTGGAVEAVVNGAGELRRVRLAPGLARGLGTAALGLGAVAALGGVIALGSLASSK